MTANGVSLAASLLAAEPSLTYRTGAVTSQGSPAAVSVAVSSDGTDAAFAEQAKGTGTCWFVIDNTAAQGTGSDHHWSGRCWYLVRQGVEHGHGLHLQRCRYPLDRDWRVVAAELLPELMPSDVLL